MRALFRGCWWSLFTGLALVGRGGELGSGAGAFTIRVVDEATGRGVPLVELRTTSEVSYWTDSAGVVAFWEPGLMDREVFFEVRSHGYEYPADGFGYRGRALRTTPGRGAELKVRRLNVAERLYRVTGQGVYGDSVLVGLPVPIREPVLNGGVMGQDTVVALPHGGRIHWFWGDTERPGYPLGHFGVSGAVSEVPGRGGLDPAVGVDLAYFTDGKGFSRPMCPEPGEGMRWLEGLMEVKDGEGRDRLVARYAVMRDLGHALEWRLGIWDDGEAVFRSAARYAVHEPHTSAHPFRVRVGLEDYWYVFPTLRVRAAWQSVTNPAAYESYTCLREVWSGEGEPAVERDGAGRPVFRWRGGVAPFTPDVQRAVVAKGRLRREENWHDVHDLEAGRRVRASPIHGSVNWNTYRRCWVGVFSGEPGEVWYAEADTPVGPWVYARRVVAHDRYNFYNPAHHRFFDQGFGRVIYFEGTYTSAFSSAPAPTPRYDYNQVMYRLDLEDSRLRLPAPVYRLRGGGGGTRLAMGEAVSGEENWTEVEGVAFYGWPPNRPRAGLVPVFVWSSGRDFRLSRHAPEGAEAWATPLFYAFGPEGDPEDRPLDGIWRCVGNMPSGTEQDFGWELHEEDGVVTGRFDPESVFRVATLDGGSFREGKLELRVSHAGARYAVSGRLAGHRLEGTWERLDEEESGTWWGEAVDRQARPRATSAVVPLFEHVQEGTGNRYYSVEDGWSSPGYKREAAPLVRVLRNPQGVLALDERARAGE